MKRVHLLLVLLIMLFSCILSAQTRQWTSGPYKVEAEFVELTKDGSGAILKNAKGVKVMKSGNTIFDCQSLTRVFETN